MNSLLTLLGIESWKPIVTALVLPPVPFLLLTLLGARLILPRRGFGWLLVLFSVAGVWICSTTGLANLLDRHVRKPPAALSREAIAELRTAVKAKRPVAIVVLGGGLEPHAPEYGVSNLTPASAERLRYGVWLARATGAPLGFSGGIGWAQRADAHSEAATAARIADEDYGRALRWTEDQSRDTRENARNMLALLKRDGIQQVVLVTHGWHMPRARRLFDEYAAGEITITPAPMGLSTHSMTPTLDWLPSTLGFERVRAVLRELLGLLVRA